MSAIAWLMARRMFASVQSETFGNTAAGTTTERDLHITISGEHVAWFTDCGTPLSP